MRPIQLPWTCRGCGDCCRLPEVVMSQEERKLLLQVAPSDRVPVWAPDRDGMAVMKGPCPFLNEQRRCVVYEHRPFNCRRFRCYRVAGEAWETDENGNCKNLTDRLIDSRAIRRDYAHKQRKAQKWALEHGWTP